MIATTAQARPGLEGAVTSHLLRDRKKISFGVFAGVPAEVNSVGLWDYWVVTLCKQKHQSPDQQIS